MTLTTTKAFASKKAVPSKAHLDANDEKILSALYDLSTAFYKKAQDAMSDLNVTPDEIHRLVSQSRSYHMKGSSYERKQKVRYDAKQNNERY